MEKHTLKREHPNRSKMLVGRGGTRGKTSGRGGKGQTARAGNKRRPALRDAIKKMPKLRGRGMNTFKSIQTKPTIVTLTQLEAVVSNGAEITRNSLVEMGIVSKVKGKIPNIKILNTGSISKKVSISGLPVSSSAKEAIERAGGNVK